MQELLGTIQLLRSLLLWVISVFHRDVDEICGLLGYNAAYSGNFSSRISWPLKMGLEGYSETSVRNHYTLRCIPEECKSNLTLFYVEYLMMIL